MLLTHRTWDRKKITGQMCYFFKVLNSAFQISQFANLIKRYVYKRDMIEICEPKLAFVTEPSPQILLVIQKGLFQFPNVWWNVLDSKVALETKLVRKWTLNFYRERNMTNKIRLLQEVWRAYYDHKSSLYLDISSFLPNLDYSGSRSSCLEVLCKKGLESCMIEQIW